MTPEVPAAADPMADPVTRKKVEQAKNFTFHLLKGIKQIGMYRHMEAKFPEYLQRAFETIDGYTKEFGALSLAVEQQNLTLHGQDLFTDETPIPYKFYRDGIRMLVFRPELEIEELVTFTMIALSEPERGADDVLAQLWKSALQHIEYIVVEGFKMDQYSAEDVQVEVDKIVNYLHGRLRTDSTDFMRFARVSTEDLDNTIEGVDQLRGAVVSGVTADDSLKAKLQKDMEEEENQRLFPKLVSAVFQVVEGGLDDGKLLEDMFIQLLDAMLIQEDFATINQVVLKLRAMEQKEGSRDHIRSLREAFVAKMGEEQRLSRVGDILRNTRYKHPQDITRYLQVLDPRMVPNLLSVLETVEISENRLLLCDVLAHFAKEIAEPFVHRIGSDRPQVVRDMVYILEKSNHPDKIKMFGKVLTSRNLAIKLDVMHIISRGRTGECRNLIADCLADPVAQVRMHAARLLCEFDREKAFLDLVRIVKDPNFQKKAPDEKAAFYAALGATGVSRAISMLVEMLTVKTTLFNKQKVIEDKQLAIHGLQGACTIQAYKVLQEFGEDKSQAPELLELARKAMQQSKKALFGEKDAPEG